MNVRLRPYNNWDDLEAMRRIVGEGLRDEPDRSYVHPGDASWWVGWPPKTAARLAQVCVVWDDDGEVLGWAMSDDDDVGDFVSPRVLDTPREEDFRRAVDGWVRELHPTALRYASDLDPTACDRLHGLGYRATGDAIVAFRRSTEDVPTARPIRVRTLERDEDVAERASIAHAAFRVERSIGGYVEDYRRFAASPAYPSGWDLVAENETGAAVACCIAWPDAISGSANFEPVATHPAFVRRGYASALMIEAMRRLRDAGMTWAIVRTPSSNAGARALYRSLGFVEWHRLLMFEQPGGG
jgi:ribosomal protein S18 acetylase RimI-like enzyme